MRLRSGLHLGDNNSVDVFHNSNATINKPKPDTNRVKPTYNSYDRNRHIIEPSLRKNRIEVFVRKHGIRMFILCGGLLLFSGWVIVPTILKVFPLVLTEIVFLQRLRWPPFINLTNPEEFRLNFTRNFRLQSDGGVELGVWHILPTSLHSNQEQNFESSLHKGVPVMLYLHGNAGTRAAWHRVQLYKQLSRLNFHVLTLDYRGFADSTGYPSEDGVVKDAITVYEYIQSINNSVPIYVWGHSLGTAIATKVTNYLCRDGHPVKGLILEAPFNNLVAAAHCHPVSWIFKPMPWFEWMFVEGLSQINISFATDKNIASVTVPTIILHAEDDGIVPFKLGKQLYDAARERKLQGSVEFVAFEGKHGYGHKHIHKSPQLPLIIKKFTGQVSDI